VRLNSLQLTNFRQHAETRIAFDIGLTGIIGPNGAGKSTVLEAIAWALYGQSAVRGTRDSIRNVRAGPRAPVRVELDFDLSGHRYRVVRALSSAELYLDGGSEPIATGITDVSDLLSRRLGMTRAEFFHTYFTGQKELSVMAAMTPAERAQFLSRVLGYDRIRTAQGLVRERRKLLGAEINGVKGMMPDPALVESMLKESSARRKEAARRRSVANTSHRDATAALALIAPQWEAAQRAREALQQLLADLRLAEQGAEGLSRDAERVARERDGVAEARRELDSVTAQLAPLSEVMEEFNLLDALAREEGRRKALTESVRSLTDELAALRTRQAGLASTASLLDGSANQLAIRTSAYEGASASLETRRTEWVRDRQEATTKRDALRAQYQDVKIHRDRIVDLGDDGVCPTCQRPLGEHYRTVHDSLDEQLETILVDGKYFGTRLEQLDAMEPEFKALEEQRKALRQEVNELERQVTRCQAAVQELAQVGREVATKEQRQEQLATELRGIPAGFDAERHATLDRELKRFGPLNEQAARLSARVDREPSLQQEHERIGCQLADALDRVASLKARYEETHFSEEDLERQRQEYGEAVSAMRLAELEQQAAILDEGRAAEAVATAERARLDLERAREMLARLESEWRMHDELDRAYTDLRTDLNFQLRPELSEVASAYLEELSDGRYRELEIDDQYNIVVLEDGIPKPVISGGEEDLSNLVLRLAISQMIADRAGQSFSLLVLDEVFGSLDDDRQRRVLGLLRRLVDRFAQVILITHVDVMKYDAVDHGFMIHYDDQAGTSVVRSFGVPDLDEFAEEVARAVA